MPAQVQDLGEQAALRVVVLGLLVVEALAQLERLHHVGAGLLQRARGTSATASSPNWVCARPSSCSEVRTASSTSISAVLAR